jgi:hypothetical protein
MKYRMLHILCVCVCVCVRAHLDAVELAGVREVDDGGGAALRHGGQGLHHVGPLLREVVEAPVVEGERLCVRARARVSYNVSARVRVRVRVCVTLSLLAVCVTKCVCACVRACVRVRVGVCLDVRARPRVRACVPRGVGAHVAAAQLSSPRQRLSGTSIICARVHVRSFDASIMMSCDHARRICCAPIARSGCAGYAARPLLWGGEPSLRTRLAMCITSVHVLRRKA